MQEGPLHFEHLPAYAQFLLDEKLEVFSIYMLKISRDEKVPLLRYFSHFSEDELIALSIEGTRKFLEHLVQNNAFQFIEDSLTAWTENLLPNIQSDEIVIEDIAKVSFARRKGFRDFLPRYSRENADFVKIMEEVDRFTTLQEELSFKTLFDLKQQKINEHLHFIEKINNTTPGVLYVFDLLEQKEIFTNHKREEMLGYSEDDMKTMGDSVVAQIIHPEDLPQAFEHIQSFSQVADGALHTNEYRVRHKQGHYEWHRAYESVFKRTPEGIPSQIIGIAINISSEKEAIKRLEHNEQQLREAQDIAGLGSFEWNLEGQGSTFSPQLFKIFEMEGTSNLMSFLDNVHPSDRKMVKEAIENAMKGDGLYEAEYRYIKDQKEKVVWSRGVVTFRDGKPVKMNGTVMDVTQRHHMLKRLERSEELHKQAQALTHLGNWSWFISTGEINWSDEMYRIYGLEPQSETITFERFLSLVHPDDRQKRLDEIQETLQTLNAADYTMRILCEDGTEKTLQGKGELLVDEDKKPYKLVGTCQDITQQFRLNEQLKESEETFRQLIFNAPDAVIVINEDSNILLWNPKAEEIFGWAKEEVTGKSLTETIIPPQYIESHLKGIERMHNTGEVRVLNKTIEITALKKNGQEFYIDLSIARSSQGGHLVFISFIRDITREKQAEMELEQHRDQLAQKNTELERSNRELTAFNYIASHDLQEPIRKIKMFGNLLNEKSRETLPPPQREFIDRMLFSADYMQQLIESLLAFSRTTSTEKNLQPVNLNLLLEEVKTSMTHLIEEKNAAIILEKLPVLEGIPLQFQQLFENIIGNALKYSKPGQPCVIKIEADVVAGHSVKAEGAVHEQHYHHISVKDNGIGFDQKYAHKVFEIFQRLHNKNEYSGTGVGLAICKKIVENHHGLITVESKAGQGAKFNIYIPIKE
ncbi:MAG: PAS domain-containing protein [Phycisphaerae bacterium]|nr:PAS domain-containing protein [Saprospiraceae bacterium]